MYDTLYLTGPHAPGGQTWLHCEIERVDAAGVHVLVQSGYSKARHFYPMSLVERVEYGNRPR